MGIAVCLDIMGAQFSRMATALNCKCMLAKPMFHKWSRKVPLDHWLPLRD